MPGTQAAIPKGEPVKVGDLVVIPIFDGITRSSASTFYRLRVDEPERRGFRIEDWAAHRDLLDDADAGRRAGEAGHARHASHFPGMLFGRLLPAEGRRRWVVNGGAA
jgi:hypothetical protein